MKIRIGPSLIFTAKFAEFQPALLEVFGKRKHLKTVFTFLLQSFIKARIASNELLQKGHLEMKLIHNIYCKQKKKSLCMMNRQAFIFAK